MTIYPKYKYSGIEWIGEIPEHWGISKLRYIGSCQNGISAGADYFGSGFPFLTYGDVYRHREVPEDFSGLAKSSNIDQQRYSVQEGDVFFTRTSETVEEIGIASTCLKPVEQATFAGFLIRFRPNKEHLFAGFSKYFFRSYLQRKFFVSKMNLVTRASLGQDLLKEHPVFIIPLEEQVQIANFLDQKTDEINTSIKQLQEFITLLELDRDSLINETVIKGLDFNVPMKYSGIEWIGDIPKHWDMRRLKYISTTRPSNVDKKTKDGEAKVMLCNYTDVYKNDFITSELSFMKASASDAQIEKFTLDVGDVILTKDSEDPSDIAIPALVKEKIENLVCGYHLTLVKPNQNLLNGNYLFRLFQSKDFNINFQLEAKGITRYGIGSESFLNVVVVLPPIEEQYKIVQYIEEEVSRIITEIEYTKQEIALLQEYKQSLITEAVTGKIDVRSYTH